MSWKKGFASAPMQRFAVVLSVLLGCGCNSAWAKPPGSDLPDVEWRGNARLESADGFARLEWRTAEQDRPALFQLVEERGGERLLSYHEGNFVDVYRVEPGIYSFRIQACRKQDAGGLECGRESRQLKLRIKDELGTRSAARIDAGTDLSASDSLVGGPDQLRPGLWYNPERPGHGWSFYWTNRLSLPESHSQHGYEYDLNGIWYTYEAKARTLGGPLPCGEGYVGEECYWEYWDYRPLAARLKLVRNGADSYEGGVFVTRNGREVLEGSATLYFSSANDRASVQWSVDFRWQRLEGADELSPLAGSIPGGTANISHYAGLWNPSSTGNFLVVDDVGALSEAVEVLFEDEAGDPVWIQAANSGNPQPGYTSLCFYYVRAGYAPDAQGSTSVAASGCDPSEAASTGNSNGGRYFTDFERARFWVDFDLPVTGSGGRITVGSRNFPGALEKAASFHRIYYTAPAGTCALTPGGSGCRVTLTWFTDGDYPEATAWAVNTTTGERRKVATSTEPAMIGYAYDLDDPGSWFFELRMGSSSGSSLMARSAALQIESADVLPPQELVVQWIDATVAEYRVQWQHPEPLQVDYYELLELAPDAAEQAYTVTPGTTTQFDLSRPQGPFGSYDYRVRACRQDGEQATCSPWSESADWQLPEPGQSGGDTHHPWADLSAGSGSLVTGVRWHYAMGYHFRPEQDGSVTELGGLFEGIKFVRLYRRDSGQLLAQAKVSSQNQWSYTGIAPVEVDAGVEYTVAVYLAGSGGSYLKTVSLPASSPHITVLGTTYAYTATNPDAVPTNLRTSVMYGQADIGFRVAGAVNRPPSLDSPGDQLNYVGDAVSLQLQAFDEDGDPVSCTASGLPAGLSVSAQCIISGTVSAAPGSYSASAVASDGKAQSETVVFSWRIETTGSLSSPDTPPQPAPRPGTGLDAESVTVGAIAGEFQVDSMGAASYRIPLRGAPGSGGLAPQLSLDYSSQFPNDLAGVGWTIGGQSAIFRCGQTTEQDGIESGRGVDLSADDRFCLDGQRLVAIDGGYGADGTEYRKELDDFSRIRSYGSSGSGPLYFIVWNGDGSASEFGNTPDSRLQSRGSSLPETVVSWAINRHQDASGNFIEYRYLADSGSAVELALDKVRYTGNSRAGTEPYAEFRFHYQDGRSDVPSAFLGGVEVARTRLLSRIDSVAKVNANDSGYQPLRSWFLTYGQDGHGRAVLELLEECSDPSATYCFEPTRFDWIKTEHTMSATGQGLGSLFSDEMRGLAVADVNGDGRPDLVIVEPSGSRFEFHVAYARAEGGFVPGAGKWPIPGNGLPDQPVQMLAADVDGDGYQDLLYPRKTGASVDWVARLSTGNGFGNERLLAGDCCGQGDPKIARVLDYNGDGLPDLMTSRGTEQLPGRGELVVMINQAEVRGDVQFTVPRVLQIDYSADLFPAGPTVSGWIMEDTAPRFADVVAGSAVGALPMDYNADGKVDLLVKVGRKYVRCGADCQLNRAAPAAVTSSSTSEWEFPDRDEQPSGGTETALAVFYILFESDGSGRFVQQQVVARGAGAECSVPEACDPWQHVPAVRQLRPVDINNDGRPDIAYSDSAGQWEFRLHNGRVLLPPERVAAPADVDAAARGWFLDLSGDGYPEFLYPSRIGHDNANWMVHQNDLGRAFAAAVNSGIRSGNPNDGDASLLLDFTGDGILDNLYLDFQRGIIDAHSTRLYPGVNLVTGSPGEATNLLRSITDGVGGRIELEYRPLTDARVHTRSNDAADADWGRGSAVLDLVAPVHVVSEVRRSAATSGQSEAMSVLQYHYAGGKVQAGGRGFLGFSQVVTWDPQLQIRVNRRFRQDFPFVGLELDQVTAHASASQRFDLLEADLQDEPQALSGVVLGYRTTQWLAQETWADSGAWWRYAASTIERKHTLAGHFTSQVTIRRNYTEYGRLSEAAVETQQAGSLQPLAIVTTRNEYLPMNSERWDLPRVASTSVTHQRDGQPGTTRRTSFEYDAQTGQLVRETVEPGHALLEASTVYGLDDFGNRVATIVTGAGMAARTSQVRFDPLGRFAISSENHYGQTVSLIRDWDAFGNALVTEDPHGVRTERFADPMGAIYVSWAETGAWERIRKRWGQGDRCTGTTAYYTRTQGGGRPTVVHCFDSLGREVREAREGFDGSYVNRDTEYDVNGRTQRVSEPYHVGEPRHWTETSYDRLGRVTEVKGPGGGSLRKAYDQDAAGYCGIDSHSVELTTNALGQAHALVRNVLGEVTETYDANCGNVRSEYDAIGNLVRVIGADGVAVEMTYDLAGRKIAMNDPAKGYWQYRWNALGELERQLDSKSQAVDYRYDALGRVTDRWERRDVASLDDGAFTTLHHETTTWQNASASSVTGKTLATAVVYREGDDGSVVHRLEHHYDSFGRRVETLSTQGGLQFQSRITYDEYGRVFQEFDPSGDDRGVRYLYNSAGYVHGLREARDGAAGVLYKRIHAMDARGNVTHMSLGNGVEAFANYESATGRLARLEAYDANGSELQDVDYSFDVLGNLRQRIDRTQSRDLTEDFRYDVLNRLVRIELTAPGLGFSAPSETLALEYDAGGSITWKSDVGTYLYGERGAGPHAVTTAGGDSFAYDRNGNQISGGGRTIDYSLFDKAVRIQGNGQETRFTYGIAHARIARTDANSVDGSRVVHYLGGTEYVEEPGGNRFRRYIGGVAIVDIFTASGATRTHYIVKDHLGSPHAITASDGKLENATWLSFDAFGQRRSADSTGLLGFGGLSAANALSSRGFTGHEHADSVGVIHMKGRLYDPRLGRFLQADPYMQSPGDSQALNRYSYVLNNPLAYTDPTGYFSLKRFVKRWGRLIVALALSVILPGPQGFLATYLNVSNVYLQAAITGFVAGGVASGNLRGAVIGSLTSLAVTGVVQAFSTGKPGPSAGIADSTGLSPASDTIEHLYGNNGPPAGLYRVELLGQQAVKSTRAISPTNLVSGEIIFVNGMNNGFRAAILNASSHLQQLGILGDSYVLYFNPTSGFISDLIEAGVDIVGTYSGLAHSRLAKSLAGIINSASEHGITGLQFFGHSQGGAIVASALRYATSAGFNLSSVVGGTVHLHGAPVNAWFAQKQITGPAGIRLVSRAQFGDAVHVLGGLNISNPLELPVSIFRLPTLFSSDAGLSPHTLPCGARQYICNP